MSKASQLAELVASQAADLTNLETHLKELATALKNLKVSQKKADKLAAGLVPKEATETSTKKAAPAKTPVKKAAAPAKKAPAKRAPAKKAATPAQTDSDSSDSE